MEIFDAILLPFGLIFSALVATPGILLPLFPFLRPLVYFLLKYKIPLGLVTLITGVVALLFPYQGLPIIGSLIPALFGVAIGLLLSLEFFVEQKITIISKKTTIWIGNVLLYLKYPIGLISLLTGILHLITPESSLL